MENEQIHNENEEKIARSEAVGGREMSEPIYDIKCEDLARGFLRDAGVDDHSNPAMVEQLAQHIQDEIELWLGRFGLEAGK